ncbi:hypothetical protein GCM10027592_54160 [Spirosoma flavus]
MSVLLGGLIASSEKDEKHKAANQVFKILAFVIGSAMFLASFYFFAENLIKLITLDKMEEFSLPIILGIWFIPFLYLLYHYIVYESAFSSIDFNVTNEDIRKFAKSQTVLHFKFNTDLLKRWYDSISVHPIKTKEDVLISFLDIKKLELIERNPPHVDVSEGWSPYKSKDFLTGNGIETNYYKNCYDNIWQASSPYILLNNEIINNNIAYYVSGDNKVAKQLKLVLNVNSQIEEDSAIYKFHECVISLYKAAFNKSIPLAISQAVINGRNKNLSILKKTVSIYKTEHINKIGGYTLVFVIKQE